MIYDFTLTWHSATKELNNLSFFVKVAVGLLSLFAALRASMTSSNSGSNPSILTAGNNFLVMMMMMMMMMMIRAGSNPPTKEL